jgi:pimeloyl-ACP methyl ester carboxylesterase
MTAKRIALAAGTLGALAVAALAALVYHDYRRDIERERARVASGSSVVQTPCGPVEYATAGEGRPLLIVHGAGGGFDQGMLFAKPFAERGFRVIAMSRFGYLRTPLQADASPAAQADAHACLLDALKIPRAAILGASAGAPSTMQFALRHPDRCDAMVLLVPLAWAPRPGNGPAEPVRLPFFFETALRSDFLFWAAIKTMRTPMVATVFATPSRVLETASGDEQARVRELMEYVLPVSERREGLLNDGKIAFSLQRYDLEKIAVPTLAISVADDAFGTFASARYTAEHIPGARFVGYPSGGHVWVGHQREIISEIAGFLERRK